MPAPVMRLADEAGGGTPPLGGLARTGAWLAVVGLASGLPASVAIVAGWAGAALVLPAVVLAVLATAAGCVRTLRPLLLVLAAAVGGLWALTTALGAVASALSDWPVALRILVVNGAKVVPLGLAALVLVWFRPSSEYSALRIGDWRADSGLRIARYRIDWRWIGAAVILVLWGGALASAAGEITPAGLVVAFVWMPVYAIAAVINSAAEEFLFRHAINATLGPWMRPAALIALSSAYFGVAHINGTPGGLAGILVAGTFGAILALAIQHTRGFCWNWTLHFAADMAIFFTLTAVTPSA